MTENEFQSYIKTCNHICMRQHLISNCWKPLLIYVILQLLLLWISNYLSFLVLIPASSIIFVICIIGWPFYIKRQYKLRENF